METHESRLRGAANFSGRRLSACAPGATIHTTSGSRQKPFLVLLSTFGIIALLLSCPACTEKVSKQPTLEEAPRLASSINMGDPTAATQLISGFHDTEGGSWRWTEKRFALTLRPPMQATQKGAVLELSLTVPQSSIEKLKSLTLTASIGGSPLEPETYTKPGSYIYRRDVAPKLISNDAVRIDFQLDKAIAPGAADLRELGLVVASARLEAK